MANLARRPNALASAGLAVLAAATAWSATVSWRVLALDPHTWLVPSIMLTLVLLTVGIIARVVGLGAGLVAAVQLVVGFATVSWQLTGSPLPLGAYGHDLVAQLSHAFELSTRVKPPAPVEGGVLPLLLLGTLISVVAVDLMVLGLARPAVAGALLVAVWSVTFWDGPVTLAWWAIAAPTAGWCLILLVSEILRRMRQADEPDSTVRIDTGSSLPVLTRAAGIGATAIVVAVAVPHIVPTDTFDLLPDGGSGGGSDRTLTVTNPMVTLKRELSLGPDYELITVQTDDPSPSYLRISVLTTFRDNAWTSGQRSVPSANQARGSMPPPAGIAPTAQLQTDDYYYDLHATDQFRSRWLPTQPWVNTTNAVGDWRYDSSTMDFLAADRGLTTAGLRWTMQSSMPRFSSSYLDSLTSTSLRQRVFTDLPTDLPGSVAALARTVTADATSPFAQAVALQEWFRNDGGFVYDTSTDLGDGADDLTTFLSAGPGGRRGFCQQFATAMAVMARTLDIPARVAVGFLRPTQIATDTWMYSAHDLHAWPELYFSGAGWVRFEPTPAVRATETPRYTREAAGPAPSAAPTTAPSASVSAAPQAPRPRGSEAEQPVNPTSTSADGASGRLVVLGVGGAGVLLVVAGVVAPRLIRRQRRHRRLHDGDPEALWTELRDTAVDLGAVWPDDASVRRQGAVLAVSGAEAAALGRLQTDVEQRRYAAGVGAGAGRGVDGGAGSPRDGQAQVRDLESVTAALWAAAGPKAARRARLWPRSLRR